MFGNILDKIRLFFHKDKESYLRFYRILGFYPRNIQLYEQAIIHRSLSVKSKEGQWMNNERLEFLGDAVLDTVVADILYRKYRGKREGFLTNTRSKIVKRETLNKLAVEIGLDRLIKFTLRHSSHNNYMCGNAFEALIGAIYLDRGYAACMDFMEHRIIGPYIDLDKISRKEMNFKSKLIEWSQKNRFNVKFVLLRQEVDQFNSPTFESEVMIEGISAGIGKGYSKKESQQEAAKLALAKIKKGGVFIDQVAAAAKKSNGTEETPKVEEPKEKASVSQPARKVDTCPEETKKIEKIISEAEDSAYKED